MTDKTDEQTQDEATTQPPLLDPPPVQIGQMVVIGNRAGKVLKISDNGESVQVEFTLTDGDKSKRWEYISDIEGQGAAVGAQFDAPDNDEHEDETAPLHNEIANLKMLLKEITDNKEHFERRAAVLERQLNELKAEQQGNAPIAVEEISATFGELKVANDKIIELTARVIELENPLVPQRPLVEVKSLVHKADWTEGVHDEPEITKLITEGFMPILKEEYRRGDWTNWALERITFKRINQQPIQPGHPMTEIDKAFDAHAPRDNPILSQTPQTPYTDLMRKGFETEEIINAANEHAIDKARAAGLASQASHTPPTSPAFLPEVITQ